MGFLHKSLNLPDVGPLRVQQFLIQIVDGLVGVPQDVAVMQLLGQAFGIALEHQLGDLCVAAAQTQLHPGHHIGHEFHRRVKFRQFPAPLSRQGMGLGFHGIIFPELGFQRAPKSGPHLGFQHTADADLAHLGGF